MEYEPFNIAFLINYIESDRFEKLREEYLPILKDLKENFEETLFINNIKCSVTRNMSGNWCGYVHLKVNPEFNEKLSVHGGITYESEKMIGFDTCHFLDLHLLDLVMAFYIDKRRRERGGDSGCEQTPGIFDRFKGRAKLYKNKDFVVEQLKGLVEQLLKYPEEWSGV